MKTKIIVEDDSNNNICEEDDAYLKLAAIRFECGIIKVYFVCPECDCVYARGYTGYGLTRVYNSGLYIS